MRLISWTLRSGSEQVSVGGPHTNMAKTLVKRKSQLKFYSA
jgi:hypothetical protein